MDDTSTNTVDKKPVCKYGSNCYRKNPDHLRNYQHPPKRPLDDAESPGAKRARRSDSPVGTEEAAGGGDPSLSPAARADGSDAGGRPDTDAAEPGTGGNADSQPSDTHDISASEPEDEDDAGQESKEDGGEVDLLPPSPVNDRDNVKQKFLVDMPKDFYSLLRFCKSHNAENPEDALAACGLRLAGPFRLLLGLVRPPKRTQDFYLTYCRYYYDPPEVQTVLCGDDARGEHLAYLRDEPTALPVQVVSNCAEENANFTVRGDNLFAAVHKRISVQLSKNSPAPELKKLQSALKEWAVRNGFTLESRTPAMRARDKLVLGKTLQGLGVVVPYDKKTEVGYRPIPETPADLRRIFGDVVQAETEHYRLVALDKLQEVVRDVQFANDEGDPGMGLELGLDVFAYGGEALHPTIKHLLPLAYDLLNRPVSAQILKAHLANRRRGPPIL